MGLSPAVTERASGAEVARLEPLTTVSHPDDVVDLGGSSGATYQLDLAELVVAGEDGGADLLPWP